jgi:acetyl esterase/lipase
MNKTIFNLTSNSMRTRSPLLPDNPHQKNPARLLSNIGRAKKISISQSKGETNRVHETILRKLANSTILKRLSFGAVVFLFGITVAHAQTPTPCPDYTPPNNPEETLAPAYQPSAYDPGDHTVLHRIRFLPDPAIWGSGPYPTVVSIHPGEFRYGDDHGEPHQRMATKDLTDAGFLVFQIEYRLAPLGLLQGQHKHDNTTAGIASGRPPQQTNDVKQEILAALADSQCNGKIFLIGGSVGHGLWAALDPNPTVPGWDSTTLTKIKAVVGLSNVCDLSLRIPLPTQTFINDVENYTNVKDSDAGAVAKQYLVSPISLVAAATKIPPTRLYASQLEPIVLPDQSVNMKNALLNRDPTADVIEYTLPGISEHAFNYWHEVNTLTNPAKCVSVQVIEFLNTYR